MSNSHPSRLRFNLGFLLEAPLGTSREIELDYPTVKAEDTILTPLTGVFSVTRTSEGVYIRGKLHSTLTAECVRCLNDMQQPITIQLDDLLYYPAWGAPEGAITITDTGIVDLGPLFRELSLLDLPIQPICKPDCLGFCMICGQNLNDADCGCEDTDIDPRFAVLKNLLDSD